MTKENVLILEDNPEIEERLLDLVDRMPTLSAIPMASPEECLEAVGNVDATVVIADSSSIVATDAGSFCRGLKDRYPNIYLVLLGTAEDLASLKETLPQSVAPDCFLAKPFAKPILRKLLKSRKPRSVKEPEAASFVPIPEEGVAAVIVEHYRRGATGRLLLQQGTGECTICFCEGRIVDALGGGLQTTLGRFLLAKGMISEEQYRQVLKEVTDPNAATERIGEALLASGLLSASKLDKALAMQAEEKVIDCMKWAHASYRFEPVSAWQDPPRVRRTMETLVMRGIMRSSALEGLIERFKPDKDRFPLLNVGDELKAARLASRLKPVLARLDGSRTVEDLAEEELLPPRDFLALLLGLCLIGALELRDTAVPSSESGAFPVVEADAGTEEALRRYLALQGKPPEVILGLDAASAPFAAKQLDEACERTLAMFESVLQGGGGPLEAKANEIRAWVQGARDALLRPTEENSPRQPAKRSLSAEFFFREGRAAIERGDLAGGIRQLEQAVAMAPSEPEYRLELASAMLAKVGSSGDHETVVSARTLAEEVLESDPELVGALAVAGQACRLLGEQERALRYYRAVQEQDPDHPEAGRAVEEIEQAAREKTAASRLLVLVSDLVFSGSSRELSEIARAELVEVHRAAFKTSTSRHFSPLFKAASLRDGEDYLLVEEPAQVLLAVKFDERVLADRKRAVWRILSFADFLRQESRTKLELHLLNSALPPEMTKTLPDVRLSIAVGSGYLQESGRVRGEVLEQGFRSLSLASDRFTIDRLTAEVLSASDETDRLLLFFSDYNYRLRLISETEGSASPVYVAHYDQGESSVEAKASAAKPRTPRAFVQPTLRVERGVSPGELGVIKDLWDEVREQFESHLQTKFQRIKEEEERKRKKSIWQTVIIGADDSKVDIERFQVKTHLFGPLLAAAYGLSDADDTPVYMGMGDFRRWFRHIAVVSESYMEAIAKERDSFLESGKEIYAGLAVDPAFQEFEEVKGFVLPAVLVASRLFPICIAPDERYEECTLGDLARIAGTRFEQAAGAIPDKARVLPLVRDIYRRAVDTPSDMIDPVNLWQWVALISLLGATAELRDERAQELADAYGEHSRKYRNEVEKLRKSYARHLTILKSGLDRFGRIRRLLMVRSPLSPLNDDRSIFEKGYRLPLFRYAK